MRDWNVFLLLQNPSADELKNVSLNEIFKENTFAYRPVVVQVGQFVCQFLQVIRFETRVVFEYNVLRWGHSALSDALADQEEVVPGWGENIMNSYRQEFILTLKNLISKTSRYV